jgi:hypothetical protein
MSKFTLIPELGVIISSKGVNAYSESEVNIAVPYFPPLDANLMRSDIDPSNPFPDRFVTKTYVFTLGKLPTGKQVYMTPYMPDDEIQQSLISRSS